MKRKWLNLAMLLVSLSLASGCGLLVPNSSSSSNADSSSGADGSSSSTAASSSDSSSNSASTSSEDRYEDYVSDKLPGNDQFDYEGNYAAPELKIDGKGDDAQWATVSTLATFGHDGAATVKVYRGESAIFFLFEVKDPILLTEGETNDDAVTRSDSIEIYIDTLADGGSKPQSDDYQINLGIHGKTRIMQGSGSGWGNWNGLIDYEVALNGTLNDGTTANDVGYSVEVMIPYSQINIEKDDTIGLSFGQVDKFGSGASSGSDWDWYGWSYGFVWREPQTPDNYVLFDKDYNLTDRDQVTKPNADMAGYVLDSVTNAPVAGATVAVTIDNEEKTATTDAQGYFVFEKVSPESTYTVTITKDGYIGNSAEYTRAELRAVDGGRVLKDILLISEESITKTNLQGTIKNLLDGTIEGAKISVDGTLLSTTSNADGTFTLANVPVEEEKNIELTISKSGYGESKLTVKLADIVTDGDKLTDLGIVNLNSEYGVTGSFGNKNNNFADSNMKIARALTGIEFYLTGSRKLSGQVELYLDTKESTGARDNETTMWLFNLNDNGTVTGSHYAGGAFTTNGLEYTLYSNGDSGYSARFFIPYTYLDIDPLEVFGISVGQWSTTASDWDGWGFEGQFVAPEQSTTLIRVSATNSLYRANNNTSMVDLSGNIGVAGVRVTVGDYSTTTGSSGSWNLKVPSTKDAVSIVYSCLGYVTKTTTIQAGYFSTHYSYYDNASLEKQYVSISGSIKDKDTGAALVGAKVSVSGTDLVATTDENGAYTLSNIPTSAEIVVVVSLDGYAAQEFVYTAETLAGASTHTLTVELISQNRIQYVTASGVITNVNGPVVGATVTVEGNSELTATTDAQGRFEINNFAGVDCTLVVSKKGYITQTITFKATNLLEDATTYQFDEVDMWMDYSQLRGVIADKSEDFATFYGYVTRSSVGFEFKFTAVRALNGHFELFVDTGTSAADGARDSSDYLFNLNADGSISITNWGGGTNTTVPANMKYTIENADSNPVINFTLPYDFLGIEKTDVIGISAGQWSTSANNGSGDWDGWDNNSQVGINGEAFVKPEWPQDYIRIAADNTTYAKADNTPVDFSSYQIHFGYGTDFLGVSTTGNAGLNPDDMWGKVAKRDENGVTFEIITTGNFGTNSSTNEKEMVLIYFDTGSESTTGWTPDYLVKIFSDGTVYGKANNAWWSATDSDKIGTATITTENGVTKISYTISYTQLGIQSNEVFGIAMREASHNAGDHMLYDPNTDCYFRGDSTGIDAADCTQFIRVAADGTLYRATSNN